MALLESTNVPLGSEMPAFNLPDPNGMMHSSSELFGVKGLLVVFTCNHCPYAIAVWPRLIRLGMHAREIGVNVVAINPNINPNYPDDAPAEMAKKIREWAVPFPYVYDETQEVARAFNAQCTPDIFLFDTNKKLVYHGEIDDNWKEESKVTKEKLKEAISCLVNGKPITGEQVPTIGCSIKWRE
jgi:thiol-disulfide isomerase/thioredoxin